LLDLLSKVLFPIIWVMETIFEFYANLTGSVGLAILLLSITFSLLLLPIQKYGRRKEDKVREKMQEVETELAPFKKTLKGEALFDETERIYKKFGYHPIQSFALGMSFIVLLPILISAIILLGSHPILEGTPFLFVQDLSKPDGLIGPINLLPVIMTAITIIDAFIRFNTDRSSLIRFLVIAVVLFLLVYNLAAALVIYWTTNVVISGVLSLKERKKMEAENG